MFLVTFCYVIKKLKNVLVNFCYVIQKHTETSLYIEHWLDLIQWRLQVVSNKILFIIACLYVKHEYLYKIGF